MTEPRIDGRKAYRDDAEYTSPEMQPGHGEVNPPEVSPAEAVGGAAGLSIGVGGGAFAGEMLAEEVEQEQEALRGRPEPEA